MELAEYALAAPDTVDVGALAQHLHAVVVEMAHAVTIAACEEALNEYGLTKDAIKVISADVERLVGELDEVAADALTRFPGPNHPKHTTNEV